MSNTKKTTHRNTTRFAYIVHQCVRTRYTRKMAKQPILKELEYFVNGATTAATISPSGLSHLVHCGLNLLHNLPASKDAVFEYFTIFFDASVAGYVKLMEVCYCLINLNILLKSVFVANSHDFIICFLL